MTRFDAYKEAVRLLEQSAQDYADALKYMQKAKVSIEYAEGDTIISGPGILGILNQVIERVAANEDAFSAMTIMQREVSR